MRLAVHLAYAESGDPTVSNLTTVLICLGVVVAVAIVALVPLFVAWYRGHRSSEAVMALAVLWGVLASVSIISAILSQMKYSQERMLLIQSGYYDPANMSDAPKLPWAIWAALAAGYGILVVWALAGRPAPQERAG